MLISDGKTTNICRAFCLRITPDDNNLVGGNVRRICQKLARYKGTII